MRNKTLSFILIVAIAALGVFAYTTRLAQAAPVAQTTGQPPRTLSINGHGEVNLTPDIAYIYVGVHTENEGAGAAVAENNDNAQAVIDASKMRVSKLKISAPRTSACTTRKIMTLKASPPMPSTL